MTRERRKVDNSCVVGIRETTKLALAKGVVLAFLK